MGGALYEKLANCHPKLQAGKVYCHICHREQTVDSAECFRTGWPKCCGSTMSLDSVDESGQKVDTPER